MGLWLALSRLVCAGYKCIYVSSMEANYVSKLLFMIFYDYYYFVLLITNQHHIEPGTNHMECITTIQTHTTSPALVYTTNL